MSNIATLVDNLPEKSMTVYMLKALDFIVPGQWSNVVGFDNAIETYLGETNPQRVLKIRNQALQLYNDSAQGYQRALWFYQTVDKADAALGAAAMASKVGESIPFFSFLSRLTPKAETSQTIDLSLKVVAELLVFCQINGLPRDVKGISQFASGLAGYSKESLMRMATLVAVDGLIPLGPDFANKVLDTMKSTGTSGLSNNQVFQQLSSAIPGDNANQKFGFVTDSFYAVQGWMNSFVSSHNLTPQVVTSSLKQYIDIADDKLEYLGAFLDMTTNYYEHTGTQSIARHLIERAAQ